MQIVHGGGAQFASRATFSALFSPLCTPTGRHVDTTTDTELLALLRFGESAGLSQLYTRYHARLMRYCSSLMNDRQKAEDIAQDVFLKLHANRQTIRDGQSIQCWLFTVARNAAYSELSRAKSSSLLDETIECMDLSPIDALESDERNHIIDRALHRLSVPYREVIVLRAYEQLSYDEIASITHSTLPSVKSRLFKARKILSARLKPIFSPRPS